MEDMFVKLRHWQARLEFTLESWRNALQTAGIDPDRHIKRYKRRKRSVNSVIERAARGKR